MQSVTGPLEGKQMFLFEQRNAHIPLLIVSAKTLSRPTEAATESCSLTLSRHS